MGSFSEDDETRFFDAGDELSSMYDLNRDSGKLVGVSFDVWTRSPGSVKERRSKFLNWWLSDQGAGDELEGDEEMFDCGSGVSMRGSGMEDQFCSTRTSLSYMSNDNVDCSESIRLEENFVCRDRNLDGRVEGNDGEIGKNRRVNYAHKVLSVFTEELENISGLSPHSQQVVQREVEQVSGTLAATKKVKKSWLSKLRSFSCIEDDPNSVKAYDVRPDATIGTGLHKVKVRNSWKRSKELSAFYMGQEIKAHEGSILAMKFSLDGRYLASAGQDGIVLVWKVVEAERSIELDIADIDPSCMYFKVNHLSELTPIFLDNGKRNKLKSLSKPRESACVIFPPKVFRILEKPLHKFCGHEGEILDLTWSSNNLLLSSSMDKTVRLWRVGYDHCLKVFLHTNYVTSVQLNPVDDDYFISGSIDGKVRIWSIPSCQVIDWADIKDIVTAVSYQPDGQGVIVGSMTGNCRFYGMSDNHLQLDSEICLTNKKSPVKRITGFQFYPQDHSIIMVTCADSSVRVLQGNKVIRKYKGLHKAGSHSSASFSPDGKHLFSACDNSNVYMWNCIEREGLSQAKKIRSCEHFSANASVVIPWCGLKHRNSENEESANALECHVSDVSLPEALPLSSPTQFFLSPGSIIDSSSKLSATWPEEKLPKSTPLSTPFAMHKSQYKFLKSSCQSSSHAWGLVILAAGWDGHIRSYYNYGLPITT